MGRMSFCAGTREVRYWTAYSTTCELDEVRKQDKASSREQLVNATRVANTT